MRNPVCLTKLISVCLIILVFSPAAKAIDVGHPIVSEFKDDHARIAHQFFIYPAVAGAKSVFVHFSTSCHSLGEVMGCSGTRVVKEIDSEALRSASSFVLDEESRSYRPYKYKIVIRVNQAAGDYEFVFSSRGKETVYRRAAWVK